MAQILCHLAPARARKETPRATFAFARSAQIVDIYAVLCRGERVTDRPISEQRVPSTDRSVTAGHGWQAPTDACQPLPRLTGCEARCFIPNVGAAGDQLDGAHRKVCRFRAWSSDTASNQPNGVCDAHAARSLRAPTRWRKPSTRLETARLDRVHQVRIGDAQAHFELGFHAANRFAHIVTPSERMRADNTVASSTSIQAPHAFGDSHAVANQPA